MLTISRTALIIATETALANCASFNDIERLALRMVAATSDRVLVGSFAITNSAWDVGCPLEQAALFPYSDTEREGRIEEDTDIFWRAFDSQVRNITGRGGSFQVEVIGA